MAALDLNDPVFIPYQSNIKLDVRAKQQVNKNQFGYYEVSDIANSFVVKQNFIPNIPNPPSDYFCGGSLFFKTDHSNIFIPPTINEGISNSLSFLAKYAGVTTEEKEQSTTMLMDDYHETLNWDWNHRQSADAVHTRLTSFFIEFEYKHVFSDIDVLYQKKAIEYFLTPITSYGTQSPSCPIMFDTNLDRVYLIPSILTSSIFLVMIATRRLYDIPEECRLYLKTNTGAYVKVGDMFNKWHRIRILCGPDTRANVYNDPDPVYINNNIHSTDPSKQYWYFNFDGYCIDQNVRLNDYIISPSNYALGLQSIDPNVNLNPHLISIINNGLIPFPRMSIGNINARIRDEYTNDIHSWQGNPVNGNQYYEGIYVDHFTVINDLNIPDPDRTEITL